MTDQIADNGSPGSRLLKRDYPDAEIVNVGGDDVVEWFKSIDPESKIFLPFNADDLRKDNERLREVLRAIETKGFNIVLPYEGMDERTQVFKADEWRHGEPLKEVNPLAGPEVDPDDEMKATTESQADEFVLQGEDDIESEEDVKPKSKSRFGIS